MIKDFDESTYLKLNPDVFEAVQKGDFPSGWYHYLSYGFLEDRPGVPPEVQRTVQLILGESSPESVPPNHLRKRVHGDEELSGYERTGGIVSLNIHGAINTAIELNEHSHILDFGCNYSQVIRYFRKLYDASHLYGTDIDKEAILWCQHNLSQIGQFVTNEAAPPLPFEDEFFDFVYSISVFPTCLKTCNLRGLTSFVA